jgi:glycosyltransferase involved in cell wall biosynthesis
MIERRILMILPESPYPPTAGNALRDAQHVSVLAQLGWSPMLALVANRRDIPPRDEIGDAAGVPCLRGRLARQERASWLAAAGAKLAYATTSTRHPFAWWLDTSELQAFVARAVTAAHAGTVVLRSLFVHTIPTIRRVFAGRLIVDCHDADEHLARELIGTVHGPRKIGPWANWRGVRRSMRAFLPTADEVWTVSDADRCRLLALAPGARVTTVRSGMESLMGPRVRVGDGRTVLLVANYGYGPNRDGALWLIREAWPRVLSRWPNARLVLAGAGASRQLVRTAAGATAVEYRRFVGDLGPLYDEAAVVAVPVWTGSGTRLKVVDAWRHGKAVVSTAKGIEGLPAAETCTVTANDAGAFAAAVVRLLTDIQLRHDLGSRALGVFERFLSLSAIAATMPPHWHLLPVAPMPRAGFAKGELCAQTAFS